MQAILPITVELQKFLSFRIEETFSVNLAVVFCVSKWPILPQWLMRITE